jgi:hypothetical protein
MGQPWRIRHLDEVLDHICARQGVWKATGREIIDWFKVETTRRPFRPPASTMLQSMTGRSSNAT